MLPGRQVAIVILALAESRHFLAIDCHRKGEITPKICHPVDDQMATTLGKNGTRCANQNETDAGQTEDAD